MPVRYNLSSVWVRLSIFSQLSIIQYVGLCVFSLPISFVMIERIYILCLIIIIKSEVWTITHCLGLGHETIVCAVCLSIFLSLIFIELYQYEEAQSDTHASRTLHNITYIFIGPPLTIFFIWINQYGFLYMHKYVLKPILIISIKWLWDVTN